MKKIFSLFLIAATLCSVTACKKAQKNENLGTLQKILVNDFENSADMGMLVIGNKLGRVRIQKEANYVRSGNGSAKVSVTGNTTWGVPYMYQTFDIEEHEEYSDFTKNVKMTLWIYNDGDKDRMIRTEYSFAQGSLGKAETELKAREWTMLSYEINRQYLPFDKTGGYFDELALYRTNKGFNRNVMYLDEHEICSFDHDYQHSLITSSGDYLHAEPGLEISQDYAQRERDFNLKVTAKAGDTPWEAGGGWPGIEINKMILEMFDFSAYDETDEFCFDVYSPPGNGLEKIWLTFENALNQRFYQGTEIPLVTGEWMTVRLSVAELNAKAVQPERYGFYGTKRIIVRWGEFTDMDRIVYLDNFRMELK